VLACVNRNRMKKHGLSLWSFVSALLLLQQCSSIPIVEIESANKNDRIDYLVIHATSENFAESLRLLTQRSSNPVSSHYLLPTLEDASYPRSDLRVYSLVDEPLRAWHAGVSYWAGEESLNDRSIGIEIVNEFKCTGTEMPLSEINLDRVVCQFPPYPDAQIEMLIELAKDILQRYPSLNPIDVIGHSDIAIMRKSDPGPLFPWQRLYEAGIGAWPDKDTTERYQDTFRLIMPSVRQLQAALQALGYQVDITGEFDQQTRFAIRAFQLHFRPADYDGYVDFETAALLWALLEKYRSRTLTEINAH
jgi:N-acetyl-anhydromuramyl-L-alanine amidase AmpD